MDKLEETASHGAGRIIPRPVMSRHQTTFGHSSTRRENTSVLSTSW